MDLHAVDFIQSMLAPGIMISACGLLILGMNNKYSLIVNRMRLLDEEMRRLNHSETELLAHQKLRLKNIAEQVGMLYKRIKLVRNAVALYSTAVAFFILTSILIGIHQGAGFTLTNTSIIIFLLGMTSVLLGVIFAVKEVLQGFKIVTVEFSGTIEK